MNFFITASLDESGIKILEKYGTVDYQPMAKTKQLIGGSRLVKKLQGVDVFITEADNLKRREIEALETLQVICSCRGNPVNIDVEAATEKGIPVLRVPARNAQGVAELTVGLMIMLLRNLLPASQILYREDNSEDMTLMSRVYFKMKGHEIWHKKIGIIGFGSIGRKVAQYLKPFEAEFFASDPFVGQTDMDPFGVKKVELDQLLEASDIVTLHVMPAPDNKGLLGAEEFAKMKSDAYFINTSRSWCTDEAALLNVLKEKKIAGAALDVFDKEPLPFDHPFLTLDNVILLPHIGGNTQEVEQHQTDILIPDLEKLLKGEKPDNIMNPEVLSRLKLRK